MRDENRLPGFDPAAIDLPTDKLTVGDLRRLSPASFTVPALLHARNIDVVRSLVGTMYIELMVAEKAYAAAAGLPDPHRQDDREEMIEGLVEEYVRYGLSPGPVHAMELIRSLETAAASQAPQRPRN